MEDIKDGARSEHHLTAPPRSLGEHTIGIDDEVLLQMSEQIPDFSSVVEKARRASHFEHHLTNWDAFKLFPKAIAFSLVLSLAIIMEGYDTSTRHFKSDSELLPSKVVTKLAQTGRLGCRMGPMLARFADFLLPVLSQIAGATRRPCSVL